MRSKKELEREIAHMREDIQRIKGNAVESEVTSLIANKMKADETSSGLLSIIKMVVEENRKNNLILKSISENLTRLETELVGEDYYEQDDQSANDRAAIDKPSKVQPVSGLDARILQVIQLKDMACADDVKKEMGYSGRNAASARLNRLYKQGLLERHQLGHRVYYKLSSIATDTLIISPPQ